MTQENIIRKTRTFLDREAAAMTNEMRWDILTKISAFADWLPSDDDSSTQYVRVGCSIPESDLIVAMDGGKPLDRSDSKAVVESFVRKQLDILFFGNRAFAMTGLIDADRTAQLPTGLINDGRPSREQVKNLLSFCNNTTRDRSNVRLFIPCSSLFASDDVIAEALRDSEAITSIVRAPVLNSLPSGPVVVACDAGKIKMRKKLDMKLFSTDFGLDPVRLTWSMQICGVWAAPGTVTVWQ